MHSFIKALPRSLAKLRFKYICKLAPYFPDFSDRSINRHVATYAVLPAFIIRWLHRSPIDFRMLTVKDGKQTCPHAAWTATYLTQFKAHDPFR